MFPTNVCQSRCSPDLYYPVLIFPSTHVSPSLHVPQFLCSPNVFPRPLCSSDMFTTPYIPQKCSTVPMLPSRRCVCKSLYSNKSSLSLYVYSAYIPKKVGPVPIFPKDDPLSLSSPSLNSTVMTPLYPRSVFHSLCSPNMFPSPYVPQRCPAVPMPLIPFAGIFGKIFGEHRDWKHVTGSSGLGYKGTGGHGEYKYWGAWELGNIFGEHRDGKTLLRNIGTGTIGTEKRVLGNTSGGYRDCEHCDWGNTFVEHVDSKTPLGDKGTGIHLWGTWGLDNNAGEHRNRKAVIMEHRD